MSESGQSSAPFEGFSGPRRERGSLRERITAATRKPEPYCIADLITDAQMPDELRGPVRELTVSLVSALRRIGQRGGVEGLVAEYDLSSKEGVALMCLAEALLRIPDNATRDALIRDKVGPGDWEAHIGEGRSLFVNAATWGLVVTGRLVAGVDDEGLSAALTRLIARAGEPVIRRGVDLAMELMGEQFVCGETIAEALKRSRAMERLGFTYSYDMLGEAATTAHDAERYYADYERAIHAIGKAAEGRALHSGPGISIKLSALHPRYSRAQLARVTDELLPRLRKLALLAKDYGIGLNIDAEEADRLEISLDLLEALACDQQLAGWNGLGFVVQAYNKRAPFVIDWLIDLARRSGHRIMVRLVKGAYWDSEIKKAQVDGMPDFPVYTRKVHTDLAYLACARKLLAHRDVLYPQFATHNAQTLSSIYHLAGPDFEAGDWEFQCLHGMGEPLYEQVVGKDGLDRPCRIYAPVGTHETLLAYLVRRLLENGANSSFVHRIWDEDVAAEDLAQDPVEEARQIEPLGAPHGLISLPRNLLPGRANSRGLDLSDESVLSRLSQTLEASAREDWHAQPLIPGLQAERTAPPVCNPGDARDLVGTASFARERDAVFAARVSAEAAPGWSATPVSERAACLRRAADLLESDMERLMGLIMREAGKIAANAVSEVREAVDFLRYYADRADETLSRASQPLGPVVCISPWNFPLAIFTGQVAAALVAGNPVLAKPAEQTPLIAAEAVRVLHRAGIPQSVLQFLPGDGSVGAALVAAPEVAGVLFTGSTEVARLIQRQLAQRLSPGGLPIPLIAETGGQNAMIVDSSALAEQVTGDVIASAFDSAGQRCSALRVLCLQEDIADRQLEMLKGALAELRIGPVDALSADIGPVIDEEARQGIERHVEAMARAGCGIERLSLPDDTAHGTFVAPTIIEIDHISRLEREVFGPVLHVVRYRRNGLGELVDAINATGYGLTFGLHTRLDETVQFVTARIGAGNIYVNRNTIGAVVGVQPFGGRGLSGTGPKAGGPLYLGRLVREQRLEALSLSEVELPGPVGERNLYALHPRGEVLLFPATEAGLARQIEAAKETGNRPTIFLPEGSGLSASVPQDAQTVAALPDRNIWAAVLVEQADTAVLSQIAAMEGPIPLIQAAGPQGGYCLDWLREEVVTSINMTAAGGNASLMAVA